MLYVGPPFAQRYIPSPTSDHPSSGEGSNTTTAAGIGTGTGTLNRLRLTAKLVEAMLAEAVPSPRTHARRTNTTNTTAMYNQALTTLRSLEQVAAQAPSLLPHVSPQLCAMVTHPATPHAPRAVVDTLLSLCVTLGHHHPEHCPALAAAVHRLDVRLQGPTTAAAAAAAGGVAASAMPRSCGRAVALPGGGVGTGAHLFDLVQAVRARAHELSAAAGAVAPVATPAPAPAPTAPTATAAATAAPTGVVGAAE